MAYTPALRLILWHAFRQPPSTWGAGGGADGHVQHAEHGEHAVGVCDDGAGAQGGLDEELEGRAEAVAGPFKAQEVANTLWAYARMGREPGAGAMRELEGRAEALAGTFIAKNVANTLWAYATMGQEPGAGLMSGLEGRAEALAGTFNAQDMANTLWAYATMGREPGAGLMRELEGRAEARSFPPARPVCAAYRSGRGPNRSAGQKGARDDRGDQGRRKRASTSQE